MMLLHVLCYTEECLQVASGLIHYKWGVLAYTSSSWVYRKNVVAQCK